MAPNIFARLIF